MKEYYPLIDLFAGAGGLGEGFSSFATAKNQKPFKIALSIEKDTDACSTLLLRSFYNKFEKGRVPEEYWQYLRGNLTREELFKFYPKESSKAAEEVKCIELGKTPYRDFVKENGDKKRITPGVCVTCDPIRDIEARLSLCIGAHKTLTEQVNGWDLPLCPGRIICLKYEGMKFVYVKTIDVQRFVTEYYSFKHKWSGWLFNTKLFCRLFLEEMKHKLGISK